MQTGVQSYWLWEEMDKQDVVSLNPPTDTKWLIFAHIKYYCCLKIPKINNKEAGNGPFKKLVEVQR